MLFTVEPFLQPRVESLQIEAIFLREQANTPMRITLQTETAFVQRILMPTGCEDFLAKKSGILERLV